MTTRTETKQARVLTAEDLKILRYPLPESWKKGIGLLKGKGIDPVRYQQGVRKGWGKRLKRQVVLGKHGR